MNKRNQLFAFSLSCALLSSCGVSPVLPPDMTYNSSSLNLPAPKKNCGCSSSSSSSSVKSNGNNGSIPDSPDVSGSVQVPDDSKAQPLTPVKTVETPKKDDSLGSGDNLPDLDIGMPDSSPGEDSPSAPKEKTKFGKVIDNVKNFFNGIFKKKSA